MLANVLPGLREIRAPLISGYLWMAFFFMVLQDDLPTGSDPGVLQPFFELGDDLSALGLATAAGIAAYLIGSAVQELWKLLARWVSPRRPLYGEAGICTSTAGQRDVEEAVRIRVQEIMRTLFQIALSPGERGIDDAPTPEVVERELPLVRTLLLGERPELVGELDRLKAEADLRITIAFPLAFISVFLAFESSLSWLAVSIPAGLLLIQGYQRQVEAGDLLAKALRIGQADAPSLEALSSSVDAVLDRVKLESELRKEVDAGDGMAAFRLGNLQASWGDFEAAVTSLEFAADRGIVRAYAEVGRVHQKRKDLKRAERAYRDGDERSDEKASQLLAELLSLLDREEEAREATERSGEEKAKPARERVSEVLQGDSQQAKDYRRRIRAGDAKAAINLGLLLERQGDRKGAVDAFRQATEIDREDPYAWIRLGEGEIGRARLTSARTAIERALELQVEELGSDHLEVAKTRGRLGDVVLALGGYEGAARLQEQALAAKESELKPDDASVLRTVMALARARLLLGQPDRALALDTRALEMTERRAPNSIDHAIALGGLSHTEIELGRYVRARDLRKQAVEIQERLLDSTSPELAISIGNLGNCHFYLGAYREARDLQERALAMLEAQDDPKGLDVGLLSNNLGCSLEKLGQVERARELYEKAVEIRQAYLPPGHPSIAKAIGALGGAHFKLGQLESALELQEQAREIQAGIPGPNRLQYAEILREVGQTLRELKRLRESEERLRQSVAIDEAQPVSDHPDLAESFRELALTLSDLGRLGEARELIERAGDIQRRILGNDHPLLAETLDAAALILSRLNQDEPAGDALARAAEIRAQHGL